MSVIRRQQFALNSNSYTTGSILTNIHKNVSWTSYKYESVKGYLCNINVDFLSITKHKSHFSRIANKEDPYQTGFFYLCCLSRLFWYAASFQNFRTITAYEILLHLLLLQKSDWISSIFATVYCKSGKFHEGFFHETWRMRIFAKIEPSRNCKNSLSFTDVGNSWQN